MQDVKSKTVFVEPPALKVTVLVEDSLVIQQRFVQEFSNVDEFEGIVQDHNARFNKGGAIVEPDDTGNSRESSTLFAVGTDITNVAQLLERGKLVSIEVGDATVYCDDEGEHLYLGNRTEADVHISKCTELFGCGSGKWALCKDGQD